MSEPREGRISIVGEPSPIASIATTLKQDQRLGDDVDVVVNGPAIEARLPDALVAVVRTADIGGAEPYLKRLAEHRCGMLLVGDAPAGFLSSLPKAAIVSLIPEPPHGDALYLAVHGLAERLALRAHDERKARWLKRYRYELGELVEIARALTQERDIDRLLYLILEKSRFVTGSDAGSIYVIEEAPEGETERSLRFKLSQNDSCDFESSEFTMPVSMRSIAGAAVMTRKPINIPDVYAIPEDAPYGFDQSFDEKVGYRTVSMIAVPMISAEDEVIGVIQLINKKSTPEKLLSSPGDFEENVVPFDERGEELLLTLASQAGIALENALLYDEIKGIFEGFVRASVQAIEQRDPTTSGHSLRVSVLSCSLAQIVDRVDGGPYASATFTQRDLKELEYASLLHDFGKIGVREKVLVKAKKLYPYELERVKTRFDYQLKAAEADALARKVELISAGAGASDLAKLDEELEQVRGELRGALAVILAANEPTVLNEGDFTALLQLAKREIVGADGSRGTLLTADELASLQVTRGSLNPPEIDEIRSHVVHTFNFLSRIPWGKTMARIPQIAGAHHEKLNGNGYPRGVEADQIPLQSKIMTIADIYDALTARDRPYKKAIPVTRALDILGYEVKDGHIDEELVRLFTEARVYEAVQQDLSY